MNLVVETAAELRAQAARWLASQAGQPLLVLARTRALADDALRAAAIPGSLGIRRLSLNAYASALAGPELARQGLRRMGPLGMEAALASALQRAREQASLRELLPIAEMPNTPRALARTIRDLRMNRVSLHSDSDVARILHLYLAELERLHLADPARILETALHLLKQQPPREPVLLLDPPHDHVLERELVAALAAHGTLLTLRTTPLSDIPPVRTRLAAARTQLFSTRPVHRLRPDESVAFFSAASEQLEYVEIARRILRLAASGARFDRMAILLRDRAMQPLIEEALQRAGIPAYFTRGSVRPHAAGRALLALLRCREEDYSSVRFCEYLSLGQARRTGDIAKTVDVVATDEFLAPISAAPVGAAEIAPELPIPRRWERLIVDAHIIGNAAAWARRLEGYANELELQLKKATPEKQTWIQTDLDQLQALRQFALPLIDKLQEAPESATFSQWILWLQDLSRLALREPEPVLEILAELEPMGSVGPVPLAAVVRVLRPRLTSAAKEPPPSPFGHVLVTTLEEARGRSFDTVFLPGLAEGVFPRRIVEDPLLLDIERQRLSRDLPRREDIRAQERALLHAAVAAAHERLVLSYARSDAASGRARVPSFYALEVLRAAGGHLPDLAELERAAASASEPTVLWPAPHNELDAIDEFEFDLARIRKALRGDLGNGSLRYLLLENQFAARAMRARHRRWEKPGFTRDDGLVTPPEIEPVQKHALQAYSLREREYSVTALERFATCPYQFYLAGMLHLRPREHATPLPYLDPLTRGSFFHEVLDRFFKRVRQFSPAEDLALEVLNETFDDTAAEYTDLLMPANLTLWHSELDDVRLDLHGWLQTWLKDRSQWTPVASEHDFRDLLLLGNARVRGKIDLLERETHGTFLRVTDFKTGKPNKPLGTVNAGRQLQPVLYALAAEREMKTDVREARLFYATQRGGYVERHVKLDDRTLDSTATVLSEVDASIREGFLPAAPMLADTCAMCDFRKVCGPDEARRLTIKKSELLTHLQRVRSQS